MKYKWPIGIALLLMLVELGVELIQPLVIQRIIDDGILKGDSGTVWTWGAVMAGLALAAFLSGVTNSYFAAHAAHSFGFDLRVALFKKIQSFTMSTFLRFPQSGLLTRMTSDITQVMNVLYMSLRIMLRAPLAAAGALIMSFIVNPKLALFLMIGVPFLIVFLVFMVRRGVTMFGMVQRRLDRVNRVVQENLQGVRLVKAYLRGAYESSRFAKVADALRSDTVTAVRLMELILPVLLFVMNASLLAVLWFGASQVRAGDAQVGEVVAIVNYALRMTGSFSMFSFIIVAYSRAKASAERMEEVLLADGGSETAESGTGEMPAGDLRFEHVSFKYEGAEKGVLHDVSFHVRPGEKLAIMGATGAGKSTLLNLIPRFFAPTEGRILIDGRDIAAWPLKDLRDAIGYVPQQSMLFTGSIHENLGWGDPEAGLDELEEAAQKAQIHDSVERFPDQYGTRVGQKGVNLSGGQKQRLSIARALVRRPSILILDDSTSALDVKTEAALWEALEEERATMLVVTQKIGTAAGADRVLLMEEGRVAGYGTHEELLGQSELYRQIVESQAQHDGEVDADA
ncbi:ATP-binding cassette, subfamily B [Edaphobacillus lindanitolerans]|uniref:ATP-binding cassette, subfamily B n=2 Tax=Edaphobacillus lindanitolerans TaxID=550447 RepID=A0A1U7PMJ8_9BACI|nr:ATP-binding cassette, subfamily B [Edaphobacillus lindanitolerans]